MTSVEMPRKYVPPPLELVKSRIEELLPPAAKEEIDDGAVLIDVRDPERYEAGHLDGRDQRPLRRQRPRRPRAGLRRGDRGGRRGPG